MKNINKIYQLERLVKSGGDVNLISNLRKELGFPEINNGKRYDFNKEEYINLKAQGYLDKDILKIMKVSTATLVRYKKQEGLTKEKINELLMCRKMSS